MSGNVIFVARNFTKVYGLRLNHLLLSLSTSWLFGNVTEAYETNVSFLVQLVTISVVF